MSKQKYTAKWMTVTAMFMALNVIMSSFGIPVPGGHFYLNDVIICTAAILLDPLAAFMVGGVGSFLGDFFFYPTPMLVSLVTHGLQAVVISLCVRHAFPEHKKAAAILGVSLGAVIMVAGYTAGRAFIYANPSTAVMKLPYQILQAAIGAVASILLCYRCGLQKLFKKQEADK